MKFHLNSVALVLTSAATCSAFAPAARLALDSNSASRTSSLNSHNDEEVNVIKFKHIQDNVKGAIASSLMAASLWASPSAFFGSVSSVTNPSENSVWNGIRSTVVADAKEMASASGSKVNKDAESLLRYGLPIPKDKEIRKFQVTIEDIRQDIGSKRKSAAIDGVKKTRTQINSKSSAFAGMCRDSSKCSAILKNMDELLDPLDASLKESTSYLNGSDQERSALDKAYKKQDELQKLLSTLEEQMVPAGYVTPVPDDYSDLPQLKGRASVEFVLQKPDKAPFDIEGTNFPEAKMLMVIDGYSSPVTGGNFVDLVQKGFYNNMKIQRSDGFVVQTGDPDGEADGYVGTPSKSVGKGKHGERLIPLEITVKGDKGPFYETSIEDEGRGGEATVLPFSSYGAMGWAREEYEPNTGSSQFFWLLFDSDLTPAGKNVLDGQYPCFGYVVEGADFLRDIKEEDIIVSAKIIGGAQNLVQPN